MVEVLAPLRRPWSRTTCRSSPICGCMTAEWQGSGRLVFEDAALGIRVALDAVLRWAGRDDYGTITQEGDRWRHRARRFARGAADVFVAVHVAAHRRHDDRRGVCDRAVSAAGERQVRRRGRGHRRDWLLHRGRARDGPGVVLRPICNVSAWASVERRAAAAGRVDQADRPGARALRDCARAGGSRAGRGVVDPCSTPTRTVDRPRRRRP
jgi:hypothetical protein